MRLRLWHLNLAVFGVLGLLLALFGSDLVRARYSLPAYLSGRPLEPVEVLLERQAVTILRAEGDVERAKGLLERAVAIDPASSAGYVLGDVLKMQGDLDGALVRHLEYNRVAPWYYPAYLSLAGLYRSQGRDAEGTAVLERGLAHFELLIERFEPVPSDSVEERFNSKAEAIHEYYKEAAFLLSLELTP
jgi:tetratricopeptide (TPR) repeat protein